MRARPSNRGHCADCLNRRAGRRVPPVAGWPPRSMRRHLDRHRHRPRPAVPAGRRGRVARAGARHTRRVFGLAYRFVGTRGRGGGPDPGDLREGVPEPGPLSRVATGAFATWLDDRRAQPGDRRLPPAARGATRRIEDPAVLDVCRRARRARCAASSARSACGSSTAGLRALPADLREPLVLCDLQGLPYEESGEHPADPAGHGEEPHQPRPAGAGRASAWAARRAAGEPPVRDALDCVARPRSCSPTTSRARSTARSRADLAPTWPPARSAARCARPWPSVPRCCARPPSSRRPTSPTGGARVLGGGARADRPRASARVRGPTRPRPGPAGSPSAVRGAGAGGRRSPWSSPPAW